MTEIRPAVSPGDIAAVRGLFEEYWDSFGFTPCFQGFGDELAALPGSYAPPSGRLLIAFVDDRPAGCVALRRVDALRCEAKRLYVRPAFRGSGLGLRLMQSVIVEARGAGYSELVGDTMPVMERALAMYDRLGFERVESQHADPAPGAIYIRLRLSESLP